MGTPHGREVERSPLTVVRVPWWLKELKATITQPSRSNGIGPLQAVLPLPAPIALLPDPPSTLRATIPQH